MAESIPVSPAGRKSADAKKPEAVVTAPEIVTPSRPKVAFAITVLQAKNLVAAKGEAAPVNSACRIQFLADPTADSELVKDSKNPTYNFARSFEREFSEAFANEVLNTPLRVSVLEGSGKTQTSLGTASIELEPLFDVGKLSNWYPLIGANGPTGAEVQIEISTGDPIHQADQSSETAKHNVVVLRADYVASVPQRWSLGPKNESRNGVFSYNLVGKLPSGVAASDNTELRLANGALTPFTPPAAEGAKPEEPQLRVTWPAPVKRYVPKEVVARWLPLLEKADPAGGTIVLELTRVLTKEYDTLEDKNAFKYTGLVNLDVTLLAVPGTQTVSGTFAVSNLRRQTLDPVSSIPNSRRPSLSAATIEVTPPPKTPDNKAKPPTTPSKDKAADPKAAAAAAGGKGDAKGAPAKGKKQKETLDAFLAVEEDEVDAPYEASSTQVKLELQFAKPLFIRPPTPRAIVNVADFIPKRAPFPRFYQLHEAAEEFELQVKTLAESLAVEYLKLFGDDEDGDPTRDKADRRKRFIFELNHNGKYFAFKEKLKRTVVRVVREKFHRNAFPAKNEIQEFITELYVFLIDEMHIALNALIKERTEPNKEVKSNNIFRVSDVTSLEGLKRLADEAEMIGKTDLAAQYYKERVSKVNWNPDLWLDYAQFSLRSKNVARAEECLVEAIVQDRKHAQSLTLYGALTLNNGEYTKSEAFLREAAVADPGDYVIQSLLGKLFELMEVEDNGAEYTKTAVRLHKEGGGERSLNLEVAEYALQNHLPVLADRFINKEIVATGGSDVGLLLAKVAVQRQDMASADVQLREVLTNDPDNADAWAQYADMAWAKNDEDTATAAYENALRIYESQDVIKLYILLRLGELYHSVGQFESAKLTFLKICKLSPSAYPWLGVGRACLRLEEFQNAQDALAEANVQNPRDGRVWGHIALLCHITKRQREAELALREALRLDFADPDVLREIGEQYLKDGKPSNAEQCLRLAMQNESPARSRTVRLLADALKTSGASNEALSYYQQVVNWSKEGVRGEDIDHATFVINSILFHGAR